jgi:hypothetical protein
MSARFVRSFLPSSRWILIGFLMCKSLAAQNIPDPEVMSFSIEELAKAKVHTAFRHLEDSSQAPSAVTIIPADDIRRYRRRTLSDALRSVRGFYTAYDRDYTYLGARADEGGRVSNPQITVFVINRAEVAESLLANASGQAGRILQKAGINSRWVNCPKTPDSFQAADCAQQLKTGELVVRIVPRGRTVSESIFGVSFLTDDRGAYADVFFEPLRHVCEVNRDLSLAAMLGSVMAHELGHLLLGSNAHSQDGIMQAHWNAEQLHRLVRGNMRFTPEQATKMRSRLEAYRPIETMAVSSARR